MYDFWQNVANTPWWVFVLIGYLFWLSLESTQSKMISRIKIKLAPFILILFSMIALYSKITWDIFYSSLWLGAGIVGILLGWMQFALLKVKASKDQGMLFVPGNYQFLIIIIMLFISRYYFGFEFTLDAAKIKEASYGTMLIIFYGFITGLLVGRMSYAEKCFKKGPYYKE